MIGKQFGPWNYGTRAAASNVRPYCGAAAPVGDLAVYRSPVFDTGVKTIDDDTVDPEGRWWRLETTPAFLDYTLPTPDEGRAPTLKYSEDYFIVIAPFRIDYSFTIHPADADPGNRVLGFNMGAAIAMRSGATHLAYMSILSGTSYTTSYTVYLNDEDAGAGNKTYSSANAGYYLNSGSPQIQTNTVLATKTGVIDTFRFVFNILPPGAGQKMYGTFRFRLTGDMYFYKYETENY